MGKILASGHGFGSMLTTTKNRGYTNENTILEVDDPTDMQSAWKIREK